MGSVCVGQPVYAEGEGGCPHECGWQGAGAGRGATLSSWGRGQLVDTNVMRQYGGRYTWPGLVPFSPAGRDGPSRARDRLGLGEDQDLPNGTRHAGAPRHWVGQRLGRLAQDAGPRQALGAVLRRDGPFLWLAALAAPRLLLPAPLPLAFHLVDRHRHVEARAALRAPRRRGPDRLWGAVRAVPAPAEVQSGRGSRMGGRAAGPAAARSAAVGGTPAAGSLAPAPTTGGRAAESWCTDARAAGPWCLRTCRAQPGEWGSVCRAPWRCTSPKKSISHPS